MRFLDGLFARLFGRKKDPMALPPHADGPSTSAPPSMPLRQYDIHRMPALPADMPTDESLGITHIGPHPWISPCPHPDAPRAFSFVVRGSRIRLDEITLNRCAADMVKLLDATSLTCAGCGKPIVASSPIATAWIGAPHPFTHVECAENQELICGMLSFGKVLTLHECNPQFPVDSATRGQATIRAEAEQRARASDDQDVADDDALDAEFEDVDDEPPSGNGGGEVN